VYESLRVETRHGLFEECDDVFVGAIQSATVGYLLMDVMKLVIEYLPIPRVCFGDTEVAGILWMVMPTANSLYTEKVTWTVHKILFPFLGLKLSDGRFHMPNTIVLSSLALHQVASVKLNQLAAVRHSNPHLSNVYISNVRPETCVLTTTTTTTTTSVIQRAEPYVFMGHLMYHTYSGEKQQPMARQIMVDFMWVNAVDSSVVLKPPPSFHFLSGHGRFDHVVQVVGDRLCLCGHYEWWHWKVGMSEWECMKMPLSTSRFKMRITCMIVNGTGVECVGFIRSNNLAPWSPRLTGPYDDLYHLVYNTDTGEFAVPPQPCFKRKPLAGRDVTGEICFMGELQSETGPIALFQKWSSSLIRCKFDWALNRWIYYVPKVTDHKAFRIIYSAFMGCKGTPLISGDYMILRKCNEWPKWNVIDISDPLRWHTVTHNHRPLS
jgi:hypothetical protein